MHARRTAARPGDHSRSVHAGERHDCLLTMDVAPAVDAGIHAGKLNSRRGLGGPALQPTTP
jgi:hypothetical protein